MKERRQDYMSLEQLYTDISGIKESIVRVESDVLHIKEKVDLHDRRVNGIGGQDKGCFERIGIIESGQKWLWGVIGLAVTAVIAAFSILWERIPRS